MGGGEASPEVLLAAAEATARPPVSGPESTGPPEGLRMIRSAPGMSEAPRPALLRTRPRPAWAAGGAVRGEPRWTGAPRGKAAPNTPTELTVMAVAVVTCTCDGSVLLS